MKREDLQVAVISVVSILTAFAVVAIWMASPPARSSTSTVRASSAAPAATWREVKTFSGTGIVDTDDFRITSQKWRIRYSPRQTQDAALFQIYVYSADQQLKGVAANVQSGGEGVSVQRGAGEYYLKVNSFGVDWSVVVEEEM